MYMIKRLTIIKFILLNTCFSLISMAAELPVTFGGFIDSYYAYDFNRPGDHERDFTTQPVRHNEFNVNLAYLEGIVAREKTRGRLALQFGNSVTRNYSSETHAKYLQEAYVGKKISPRTWIDGGIFLGNIGAESWVSKNNWTYSRSLNLDYVPYYSAGVRVDHQFSSTRTGQFHIINGWQNISENNSGKAFGMQFKEIISDTLIFTYNNFFGDEEVVPDPKTGKYNSRFRSYHNFILQWNLNEKWQFLGTLDFGHQAQQSNNGSDGWGATTLTVRRVINERKAVAVRAEYYADPHQANVSTGTENGFRVTSLSMNFDQKIDKNALWRTELRGFKSKDEIYPAERNGKSSYNGFLVTSLAVWF